MMDIFLALFLTVFLAPVIAILAGLVLVIDGRPIFFSSVRARAPGQNFRLWKLRTMRGDSAQMGVTGGDKSKRITRLGGFLRRNRLDEFPQLWNILKGDISFVGPRPPLPVYVEMFPELYARVLESRPGVTGLATLVFHRTEEKLLESCKTAAETEAVYVRRCIPRKAKIDMLYAGKRTFCGDLALILATVGGRFWWRRR